MERSVKQRRLALTVGFFAAALMLGAGEANADVTIYNSLADVGSRPTEGYQCCQMSAFGDEVSFAGSARDLSTVVVEVADFSKYSAYASKGYSAAGWTTPLTLTLYNVGSGNTLGSVIASETISPTILWSPESQNALRQYVTFDFTGTTVPDSIIYALSFNTQSYGSAPTGVDGPYNGLNFVLGWNCVGACTTDYPMYAGTEITVGSEVDPGYLWYDTAGYRLSGGTANELGQNNYVAALGAEFGGTSKYWTAPSVQFNAVPEPSAWFLMLFGFGAIGFAMRCERRTRLAAA